MTSVIVNGLTIVHQGSNGLAVASAPDVCKTPMPPGPTPIPYPNIAKSSDLADGTTTVFTDGCSAAIKDCCFATSTGDEGGTAGGGVSSGVIKGKAKFSSYSFDVKLESKNACRLTDPMTMNGNASNTVTAAETQAGGSISGLGGDFEDLCRAFCWCDSGDKKGGDILQIEKIPVSPRMTA
jgi:hypothetical protein